MLNEILITLTVCIDTYLMSVNYNSSGIKIPFWSGFVLSFISSIVSYHLFAGLHFCYKSDCKLNFKGYDDSFDLMDIEVKNEYPPYSSESILHKQIASLLQAFLNKEGSKKSWSYNKENYEIYLHLLKTYLLVFLKNHLWTYN